MSIFFGPSGAGIALSMMKSLVAVSFNLSNSVLGADAHTGEQYKKNFAEAYPGDSLANLNPWPAEAPWYADVRTEHVNKFKSA